MNEVCGCFAGMIMGPQTAFSMLGGAIFGEAATKISRLPPRFPACCLANRPVSIAITDTGKGGPLLHSRRLRDLGTVCTGTGVGARSHHGLADGSLRVDPVGVVGDHGGRQRDQPRPPVRVGRQRLLAQLEVRCGLHALAADLVWRMCSLILCSTLSCRHESPA